MVSQTTTIINKSGIHARPASVLAKLCSKCDSEIILCVGEKRLNPKSILILMSAAIKCGTDIVVECTGETEKDDLEMIIEGIASGLGEE